MQKFHLQQLAILVSIVSTHIRNYTPVIFGMITELWKENLTLHVHLVALIESFGHALDLEFVEAVIKYRETDFLFTQGLSHFSRPFCLFY